MGLPLAATWELALLCNYRCPYCFVHWHEPEIGMFHLGISPNDWVAFWERMHSRYGGFHITIAGGEPFVYPGFLDMIKHVSKWHRLAVNTNLSFDPKHFIGVVIPDRITLSASFHPHYETLEIFIPRILALRSAGYDIITTVVAYPPYFEKLPQFKQAFEKAAIPYSFQPFQGKIGAKEYPRDYTDSERIFLFGESVMKSEAMALPMKATSPLGRPCAAGQRRFRVTSNGDVIRCAPALVLDLPPLGSIKDPDLQLFPEARPCPAEACHCPEEFSYLLDLEIQSSLQTETVPGAL
ncbi:MAG: radical SAM protein [Elusimicrobiota bacterium]